jgi:hypothetical protein
MLPSVRSMSRAIIGCVIALATAVIGPATAAPAEPARPSLEADFGTAGRVTYAGARAEIPLAPAAVLVPSAELLHFAPAPSDPQRELHPEIAAGVAFEPGGGAEWEVTAAYGPRASGVASVGGSVDVSRRLGAVDLDAGAGVARYAFEQPSQAGAGVAITQATFEGVAAAAVGRDLRLRTRTMLFLYGPEPRFRTPAAIDAVGILARVGSYPPRALVGFRLTWRGTSELAVLAEVNEIAYAAGVGSGTRLETGVRVHFPKGLRVTVEGGLLANRLRGVASRLGDQRTVPVVDAACEIDF